MSPVVTAFLTCGVLLLPLWDAGAGAPTPPGPQEPAEDGYVGQKACAICHKAKDHPSANDIWADSRHAEAFETLATDAAKAIAEKLEIEDPQKADECLKCHVTAFGVDKEQVKRTFKREHGVQCEACHGPADRHRKARLNARQAGGEPAAVAPEEIVASPGPDVCVRCHNETSPTYRPFCFREMSEKVRHLDPEKERTPEELKALRSRCTPDCPKCSKEKKGKDGDGGD